MRTQAVFRGATAPDQHRQFVTRAGAPQYFSTLFAGPSSVFTLLFAICCVNGDPSETGEAAVTLDTLPDDIFLQVVAAFCSVTPRMACPSSTLKYFM